MVAPASHHVKILGKPWRLQFVKLGRNADGECNKPRQRIRVDANLKPAKKHEIVIHEALHAGFWWLDEEYVAEFAKDLSRILLSPDIQKEIAPR